jgi:CHASE3 domain sensor protein
LVASACPVCFDPREENRLAFLLTTLFLTLTPLALMGGAVYWLYRRYKQVADELAREDQALEAVETAEAAAS